MMLARKKPLCDRVQLVAGRCGLKLVSSRHRVGARRYFLRQISDGTQVVLELPDGSFRFVKATRAGRLVTGYPWRPLSRCLRVELTMLLRSSRRRVANRLRAT